MNKNFFQELSGDFDFITWKTVELEDIRAIFVMIWSGSFVTKKSTMPPVNGTSDW